MARREKAPQAVPDSFFLKSPLPENAPSDAAPIEDVQKYIDELKSKLYGSQPIILEQNVTRCPMTEQDVLAEDLSALDRGSPTKSTPEPQGTIDAPAQERVPPVQQNQETNDTPPELLVDKPLVDQFAEALSAQKIPASAQVLIAQFSDQYIAARGFVRARKHDAAHEAYTTMLRLYQEINTQNIPTLHKQIAHHGLEEIYDIINAQNQHEPISKSAFVTLILASALVLLAGVTLVLNPSISGLAVLEQTTPSYTGPSTFEVFGPRRIELGTYFGINADDLTLLATRSLHVDVQVDNDGLIVVPSPGYSGDELVYVIAVNTGVQPYLMTKVPLTLIVR